MRISDWSSDVCSSDLPATGAVREAEPGGAYARAAADEGRPARVYSKWNYLPEIDTFFGITDAKVGVVLYRLDPTHAQQPIQAAEIGRDLRSERECQEG